MSGRHNPNLFHAIAECCVQSIPINNCRLRVQNSPVKRVSMFHGRSHRGADGGEQLEAAWLGLDWARVIFCDPFVRALRSSAWAATRT